MSRSSKRVAQRRATLPRWALCLALLSTVASPATLAGGSTEEGAPPPFLVVLGIAQDGGVPQAGTDHPGWKDPDHRRLVASLALVDPASRERWLFDATPDFPEQLRALDEAAPVAEGYGIDGIFLTHAHAGHYTGLMHLGHEVMGTQGVRVYAMPRMAEYLKTNGPWSQLVNYGNIQLRPLASAVGEGLAPSRDPVRLNDRLSVTPFVVPHRQEYSEVVGYRIDGPVKSVLFIPDVDSWEEFDAAGTRIEELIASVDYAYLDATFFDHDEVPGRDMSGFPHPTISHSMERFANLPDEERRKIRFIHLNHTNPALWPQTREFKEVLAEGFALAREGERVVL